jgi:hypothetical protein
MSYHNFLRLIPVIYGILMIVIVTCIFTRAFTDIKTNFIDQLYSFNYLRTYVELYFLILIDSFILIIYSIKSFQCFKYTRLILIIFQLFIYGYSLSKFLVFYEWKNVRNPISPYQLDRFDYLAIIFIPLLALGGIFIWISFFRIINIKQTDPERQNLINQTDPERQNLINQTTTTRLYTEEVDPLIIKSKSILIVFFLNGLYS